MAFINIIITSRERVRKKFLQLLMERTNLESFYRITSYNVCYTKLLRGERLAQTAGGAVDVADRLASEFQPVFPLDDTAAQECEIVVVRGNALERPKLRRVVLSVEVRNNVV